MQRRDFLKAGALALTTPLIGAATTGLAADAAASQDPYPRIGLSTTAFRARFPATRNRNGGPITTPELTMLTVSKVIVEEVGLRNIEIWEAQWEERSDDYAAKIRNAAAALGGRIIDIQVDTQGSNISDPDPAKRAQAVAAQKTWIDRAVVAGSPRVRLNSGLSAGQPHRELARTIDSYRQLAEYAERAGVTVLIENHLGTTAIDVAAIVGAVNHPRLRSLIDWGNTGGGTAEEMIADLAPTFPTLGLISAKAQEFDENYKHQNWDIAALVKATEDAGFRGIYSIELWETRNPPSDPVRAARVVRDIIAANLKS
jgi:sugar phosphate isomerase/epimerase